MASRNSLIDGWRGVSVLLVVIGHYVGYRFSDGSIPVSMHEALHSGVVPFLQNIGLRLLAPIGEVGVQFFFVISGFLITGLLAAEESKTGTISLSGFYVRRIFRIMPAFYVYFLSVWLLRSYGLIHLDNEAFVRSGFYLCNVSGFACSWWLAHTWSLSVEEQFYIVWPFVFILLGAFRARGILLIVVALAVGSVFFHGLTSFAHIAIGALFVLSERVRRIATSVSKPSTVSLAAILLMMQPVLAVKPGFAIVVGPITPLLTALVFFATINGVGPLRRIVAFGWLQKIGLISYSVYLWQQISTAPITWNGTETGAEILYSSHPYFVWVFPVAAVLSYLLIERPAQSMGRYFSARLTERRKNCSLPQT